MLNIIIGCEESQAVTLAFRALGFNAYSCDLIECSGGRPDIHIKGDVFQAMKAGWVTMQNGDRVYIEKWHAGIFFPTCTYLTVSANSWYKDQPPRKSGVLVGAARRAAREEAIKFVLDIYNSDIEILGIENPIGCLSSRFRKPDQVLQPWMFGHGETKATCLWLKNLPTLTPTEIVEGRVQRLHLLPKTPDRAKLRSKTYAGIAKAMAEQWGFYLQCMEL